MEFKEYTHKYLQALSKLTSALDEKDKILQNLMDLRDKMHTMEIKELSDRIDKLEKQ